MIDFENKKYLKLKQDKSYGDKAADLINSSDILEFSLQQPSSEIDQDGGPNCAPCPAGRFPAGWGGRV